MKLSKNILLFCVLLFSSDVISGIDSGGGVTHTDILQFVNIRKTTDLGFITGELVDWRDGFDLNTPFVKEEGKGLLYQRLNIKVLANLQDISEITLKDGTVIKLDELKKSYFLK